MKDIHDHNTADLSSIEPSFSLFPHHSSMFTTLTVREQAEQRLRQKRLDGYLREKPYLAEALRRSVK